MNTNPTRKRNHPMADTLLGLTSRAAELAEDWVSQDSQPAIAIVLAAMHLHCAQLALQHLYGQTQNPGQLPKAKSTINSHHQE